MADPLATGDEPMIPDVFSWLTTGSHWQGSEGIVTRLGEHAYYTGIALLIAMAIGYPLGLAIGHTGRGGSVVTGTVNSLRALPSFGLIVLLYVVVSPLIHGRSDLVYLLPLETVLVLLAIPPILSNTHAGIQNVDPAVRDAARGMGMTGWQVLTRVEMPCSLPLAISGLRSATLQCIATATVGAYLSLGGFGRYVLDGLSQQDYPQMAGGAVLIALFAISTDTVMYLIQRVVVSAGISGRHSRRASVFSPQRSPRE